MLVEKWLDAKQGAGMKLSKSSLHFQVRGQVLRKDVILHLVKTYSIPKCHLQRAQLSQKKKKNSFCMFLQFCQIRDPLVPNCDSWDPNLKYFYLIHFNVHLHIIVFYFQQLFSIDNILPFYRMKN